MRNERLYLRDIRAACMKVLRYVEGMDQSQFVEDEQAWDATIRNLEVIGEAVKHLPPGLRTRYEEVDWRRIAGLRDILIHQYFGIDEDIVWDVVQNKVPRLLAQIETMLETDEAGQ